MVIENIIAYRRHEGNTTFDPEQFTKISSNDNVIFAKADYDVKWFGDDDFEVIPKTIFYEVDEFIKLYSFEIIGWKMSDKGWTFTDDRK